MMTIATTVKRPALIRPTLSPKFKTGVPRSAYALGTQGASGRTTERECGEHDGEIEPLRSGISTATRRRSR